MYINVCTCVQIRSGSSFVVDYVVQVFHGLLFRPILFTTPDVPVWISPAKMWTLTEKTE